MIRMRVIVGVLLACVLLSVPVSGVLGDDVIGDPVVTVTHVTSDGVDDIWKNYNGNYRVAFMYWPEDDVDALWFMIYLENWGDDEAEDYTFKIYSTTEDDGKYVADELLWSKSETFDPDAYGDTEGWMIFRLPDSGELILRSGDGYGVYVESDDDHQFRLRGRDDNPSSELKLCSEYSGVGEFGWSGCSGTDDPWFVCAGYLGGACVVETLPAEWTSDDALILRGMVTRLGSDRENGVDAYIEHGAVEDGDLSIEVDCGYVSGSMAEGRFSVTFYDMPLDELLYYRAKVIGRDSGETYYGDWESYGTPTNRSGVLGIELVENSEARLYLEAWLGSEGDYAGVDVKLECGKTYCQMVGGNSTITLAEGVSDVGTWYYEDSYEVFEGGEYYYVRTALYDGGERVASCDYITFTRWDPDLPRFVNWIGQFLDDIGLGGGEGGVFGTEWLWWLLVGVIILVSWFIALSQRGRHRHWIGILGTFIALGFVITFGLVDIWLVVLLSIIAGLIVFKVVFKKMGATGGG